MCLHCRKLKCPAIFSWEKSGISNIQLGEIWHLVSTGKLNVVKAIYFRQTIFLSTNYLIANRVFPQPVGNASTSVPIGEKFASVFVKFGQVFVALTHSVLATTIVVGKTCSECLATTIGVVRLGTYMYM